MRQEDMYQGPTLEAAEKRLFCALRFATRKPAAARKCYFSATYGTTEEVAEKVLTFPEEVG